MGEPLTRGIRERDLDGEQKVLNRDRHVLLIPAITGLLLVILILLGLWFHRTQKDNYIKRISDELSAIATLKANQITEWRKDQIEDAKVLVDSPLFKKYVTQILSDSVSTGAKTSFRELLALFKENNDLAEIVLIDRWDRMRLSLKGTEVLGKGCLEAIEEARQKMLPVLTDLHLLPGSDEPHISVVTPLFAERGAGKYYVGAILMFLEARKFLYPLIQSWPTISETAETLLVRREGDHVLFLNELRHRKDTAFKLRIPLTRFDVPAVQAVLGRKGFTEGHDYRGKEVVAFLVPVPDSPWYIVSKMDRAEAFSGWQSRSLMIFLLVSIISAGIVVAGAGFWQREKRKHYLDLYRAERKIRALTERQAVTLRAIGDGVIATDREGKIEVMNAVAEDITGWAEEEALGRPLGEVFSIKSEETGKSLEDSVERVLKEGATTGLANHTLLVNRDGKEIPIAHSGTPIKDKEGNVTGVVLVFRDQTEERMRQKMMEARLRLIDFSRVGTVEEIATEAIRETVHLTSSSSGFVCLVEDKRITLCCLDEPLRKDADSLLLREDVLFNLFGERNEPLIINDPRALKEIGLFRGDDVPVKRLIVCPVIRRDKLVLLLGNINKDEDYSAHDRETISYLADLTFALVESKIREIEVHYRERRFREIFENTRMGIAIYEAKDNGQDFLFTDINPAGARIGGRPREEHYGKSVLEVYPGVKDMGLFKVFQEVLRDGKPRHHPLTLYRDERISLWVENYICKLPSGEIMAIYEDQTEQKKKEEEERISLEKQLYQSQKMESVGRLAGGIAHDFNNMLMVILGQTDLALMDMDDKNPLKKNLLEIKKAAERSATLTRQLLAFARKQTISPRILDLNETVERLLKMLRLLIGEDVELAWFPGPNLWRIRMDPAQVDQILSNLIVNARDAIRGHGRITIETENVTIDDDYCSIHAGFVPGDYVTLVVSDTGSGMDKDILEHIFEPFFTTKDPDKGTGLGLATVYGIVKQNRGFINVYSEPGRGSTFRIYLPAERGAETVEERERDDKIRQKKGLDETILLVEDEPSILDVTKKMLEWLGYRVVTAVSPSEALSIAKSYEGRIDLLITDVVMPGMAGRELAMELSSIFPDMKCLFMSGYTANAIAHHNILDEGLFFIQKPFSFKQLATKVKEVLGTGEKAD